MGYEHNDDGLDGRIAAVMRRRRGRPRDGFSRATKYYSSYLGHQREGMSPIEAKRAVARDYSITPQHVSACVKMIENKAPELRDRRKVHKSLIRLGGKPRRGRPRGRCTLPRCARTMELPVCQRAKKPLRVKAARQAGDRGCFIGRLPVPAGEKHHLTLRPPWRR